MVPGNDNGHGQVVYQAVVREAIGKWRDSLVNLTGTNRLLNFRPVKTGRLDIVQPAPGEVLAYVSRGKSCVFRALLPLSDEAGSPLPAQPTAPQQGCLDIGRDPGQLAAAVRNLYRRSHQAFLDQGLSVLYLAFGVLSWKDEDGTRYTSPLLLVPMQLTAKGSKQLPVLDPAGDDPVANPALALKLQQYGIALPRIDPDEDIALSVFMDRVRQAVAGQDGWAVAESLVLSCFSFSKEAMYRDLMENEDRITAHAGIAALAGGGKDSAHTAAFAFDEIPDEKIDDLAPPERTPVILDADSSQRACVAAALDGRSFVMDGPPGTGKSQTIANMIATLLHAGKTVLFVSEKAAALDVVRDRLHNAGLGHFLLELHSQKATRKEVATALGRALDTVPVPPPAMPQLNADSARARREQLNAYADAMNRPRAPLDLSLHHVLGLIAKLHSVPVAPATGLAPVDLTIEVYSQIRSEADRLARAWRPARQGSSFIWRGVTERGSLESRLYQAVSALRKLQGLVQFNSELAAATGLTRPSEGAALAQLIGHLAAKPAVTPPAWLTASTLDGITTTTADLAGCLDLIEDCEKDAAEAAGVPWRSIPQACSLPVIPDLGGTVPAAATVSGLLAEQASRLSSSLEAYAGMLSSRRDSLTALAGMLGLRVPDAFGDAEDLLSAASLADTGDRPERSWLTQEGLAAAQAAAAVLRRAHDGLLRAEAEASAFYMPVVLRVDVPGLAARMTGHRGLGKLSGEYRADKKVIASFTRDGVSKDAAAQHLGLAVAWRQAADNLWRTEQWHAAALGAFYAGRATDFTLISRALAVAEMIIRRVRGQDTSRVADYIARDSAPAPGIAGVAREGEHDLAEWRNGRDQWPAELLGGTITAAIEWLRAQGEPLMLAARFAGAVSRAVGRPVTVAEARRLVALRGKADAAHTRLAGLEAKYQDSFGELYEGRGTDVGAIRRALDWTLQLRQLTADGAGPLTPAQAKAAMAATPTANLATVAAGWRQSAAVLMAAFSADRQGDLAAELDDYADGLDLLAALQQDGGGKDEWHAYLDARENLARHGLSVAIEFCIAERVPAGQVPAVIDRALLQEWAEHQLRTDPHLSPVRAQDRDDLVAEYRALDRELIAAAVGDIIRACNRRRPRSDVGEAAVIHREAQKKKKHMPVRTLIEWSRNVTLAIKPCFMMSPLSVSQFLPADIKFDVVIFDEASQVSPGDAINCIYRGAALILAGDQQQLPPTSFFRAGSADDDEEWSEESDDSADFESVLDLAKSIGAFRSLTLRWHYRSRHEALIAFSNASFYEGKMVTFPGALDDGPDVGVELFQVNGVYRRGTTRDNPAEATAVATRVLRHFDTRPQMSLGVVTFSEAQAVAIETALRNARLKRPDLDRFFNLEDRLRGFFVKSLESVQGDERDVLIFSIGYGPDENKKITMNFGPLNRQGGERRLNVAITRAHYRNEVVSSISAGDIAESVTAKGVVHLRRYLDYAARGMAALALDTSAGGDAESPFEESVITVIRSSGYEVTPQVGTAGYRIDIGVRHPDRPGVFALGVECDGYRYHSSRAARDRDRLREEILRGLGWRLHRIWGTAWYRDRYGEERKLRKAIEEAIAAPVNGLLAQTTRPATTVSRPPVITTTATFDEVPAWAEPYRIAGVPGLPGWLDPGEDGAHRYMTAAIEAVISTEGPLHLGVLHERLRAAWEIGRIGARIRANIEAAIRQAAVVRDGDFLSGADPRATAVRTPVPACQRDISQVHDCELSKALAWLTRDADGISQDELSTRVARLYGWSRRGSDITTRLHGLIAELLDEGLLAGTTDNLAAPQIS